MRGSRGDCHGCTNRIGIIPAHAGLTDFRLTSVCPGRDHPRACGAHACTDSSGMTIQGSSPRMRGSLPVKHEGNLPLGIIPAHAGLTAILMHKRSTVWDHPRACGAHRSVVSVLICVLGSSPRMRGSHITKICNQVQKGIIPAHAGLTYGRLIELGRYRDHPRACGAHNDVFIGVRPMAGSSPRMRGSPRLYNAHTLRSGIIPAHAGLTLSARRLQWRPGDHPRACGAHLPMTSIG